jgi:tetratricopeptide (TPR) repeat protein/tRNA A-37 threonylcarbamoyl transferase component Bud32
MSADEPTGSFEGSGGSSHDPDRSPTTDSWSESPGDLAVEQAIELDRVCNEFETAWRAGRPTSIKDALERVTEVLRPAAARELVAIDAFYTKKAGGSPRAEDYSARFPELDPDWLASVVAVVGPKTGGTSPDRYAKELTSGTVIAGRYILVDVIGEGGMGTVYRANQTAPVKRQVALKLIKTGMDSKTVLARFDAERQALALMDHPNIAHVFDGGTTFTGHPFFVMELVNGKPITVYCDLTRLPIRARLELFVSVCQAVQHAHQKGIIHRDLKPGNVLVTEVDGRPTPKVIDFGMAKAIEFKLTDQSFADTGVIVGTAAYMSPEQADPSSMDIDTRTDVYALGVILYELLVGSPPIRAKQFKRGAFLEMLRMVREVDPPRPSTKLSTAEALPNIAANRNIEPGQLKRALQGDLDWIVMKSLEKDRARRYESANCFAADILRHLAYEPVLAAPPSRAYRMRKFVRKNQGAVVAALAVLLVFVLGMVGTTWGLLRAEQARTAEANQSRIANEQEAARVRAEAVVALQQQSEQLRQLRNREAALALLSRAENALRAGDVIRATEALEQTQKWITEGDADDLKEKLARYGIELAMLRELDHIDNDRWTVVDGYLPSNRAMVSNWAKAFGGYGIVPGITPPEEAAQRINDSLIRERLLNSLEVWFVTDGKKPVLCGILAKSLCLNSNRAHNNLGIAQENSDELSEAIGKLKELIRIVPEFAHVPAYLGMALNYSNDVAGAIAVYKEAIRLDPKFAPAHYNLGTIYLRQGMHAATVACAREAIKFDPKYSNAHAILGFALQQMGDIPGARLALTEATRLDPKRWGPLLAKLPPIPIAPSPREVKS